MYRIRPMTWCVVCVFIHAGRLLRVSFELINARMWPELHAPEVWPLVLAVAAYWGVLAWRWTVSGAPG